MKLLRIPTDRAQSFIEVEVIDKHRDDHDERVVAMVGAVADHFARSGGTTLAVYDPETLYNVMLDELNGLDDAIEHGETESHYGMDASDARHMHRSVSALAMNVLKTSRNQAANRARPDAARAEAFDRLVGYVRSIVEPSPLIMTLSPETREKYLAPYRERLVADLDVSDIRKNTGLSAAIVRSLVERNGDDLARTLGVASVKYVKSSYSQSRKRYGWGMRGADTNPARVVVTIR
jgi:hypothetical protein